MSDANDVGEMENADKGIRSEGRNFLHVVKGDPSCWQKLFSAKPVFGGARGRGGHRRCDQFEHCLVIEAAFFSFAVTYPLTLPSIVKNSSLMVGGLLKARV